MHDTGDNFVDECGLSIIMRSLQLRFQLWKLSFINLHGLDPSPGMLKMARQKKKKPTTTSVPGRVLLLLDEKCLPIDDGQYETGVGGSRGRS